MKIALSPDRYGVWDDLPRGDRLWRTRVGSRGAQWIVLGFTTFRLPEGAKLYVYGEQDGHVQGPFDASRVFKHGQLWSTPVLGDVVTLELPPLRLALRNDDGAIDVQLHVGWSLWLSPPERDALVTFAEGLRAAGYALTQIPTALQNTL